MILFDVCAIGECSSSISGPVITLIIVGSLILVSLIIFIISKVLSKKKK